MTIITKRTHAGNGVNTKRVPTHGDSTIVASFGGDPWGGTWGNTWGNTWRIATQASAGTGASPSEHNTRRVPEEPTANNTRRVPEEPVWMFV